MTEHHRLVVSTMSVDELSIAIDWARQEGWNPGLEDAALFHAADPGGFLIGRIDGAPVATISAVRYGDGFGFVGLYIVHPAHRGQGYGWQIWQAAMARLSGRNVGLDGVVAQQANYRRSGFQLAHRNIRMAGHSRPAAPDPGCVGLTPTWLEAILRKDAACFPAPRESFLRGWLTASGTTTLVLPGENGALAGYGCLRTCHQGCKIGPLVADDMAGAGRLLTALTGRLPAGTDCFLDVPEPNRAALMLAADAGMTPSFETARMYTGAFPDLPLAMIAGITSFELG